MSLHPEFDRAGNAGARAAEAAEESAARGRAVVDAGAASQAATAAGRAYPSPTLGESVVPVAYAAAAAAARAAVGGDGAAAADAVVNLIYAAWGRAHGPLWRLGRDFAESEVVPFIRADFDRVTAAVRAGGWSDDTPVSADLFGDLWPDNVFATWSVLTDATERLAALVGRHADQVRVIWTRGGDRVGGGGLTVSVSVPAWGVEKSRAIRWGDLGDAHQLRASLFSLWDDVLKERIKAVQATGT